MPTSRQGPQSPLLSSPSTPPASGDTTTGLDPRLFSGRVLMAYRKGEMSGGIQALDNRSALKAGKIARTSDFSGGGLNVAHVLQQGDGLRIDELDVLIVSDSRTLQGFSPASIGSGPMPIISPERVVYPANLLAAPAGDNLQSLLADLDGLVRQYRGARAVGAAPASGGTPPSSFQDTSTATWGLQAVQALSSSRTGQGVNVAIIDTGIDPNHPDFANRSAGMQTQSFVNETINDVIGHGTHVAGTACGLRGASLSYGVAPNAQLFIAKVFPQGGQATDGDVLSAIAWALRNGCQVANMSLSGPAAPGAQYSAAFEQAANNALNSGLLLVAAAGNDSEGPGGTRMDPPAPVGHPANCPSVLAVAALAGDLSVAPFSNGGQSNPANGQVDFAGPGVDVVSSWPTNLSSPKTGYNILSGTSQATPHISGLAALMSESLNVAGGLRLWQALSLGPIRALPGLSTRDVGFGLLLAVQ